VIKQKEKGQTVKTPEREDEPSPVDDLMAALEKTLAEIKDGKRPVPA
jgi:non-homologous end joining protein Ku